MSPVEPAPETPIARLDVTERERTEKALRSQELAFRELLMSAVEAILMFDETGEIIFANDMAAQVFGYPREELVGLSAESLVPDAVRGEHLSHRKTFIDRKTSGRMGANRNVFGVRKDGSTFPAEVALGWAEHDKRPLVVSFVTDMSERHAAEREIREYQEKLQHMAFDAAMAEQRERRRIAVDLHDRIGQSLALVQIKLGALREVSGPARAGLDDAISLLEGCIVDTRTLTFELSPPVLYDLGLGAALSWLAEDLEKRHGIRIDLEDLAELPVDDATAGLLFRAVREVLMNVLKHAKTTRAKVSVHQIEGKIAIDVEDAGVGFSPTDPTFRTATSGFGLFSVREQLSRLGGTVELTTAPGLGTKVSLVVPTRPASRSTP
jgi:PAS domain S-box-containing protein